MRPSAFLLLLATVPAALTFADGGPHAVQEYENVTLVEVPVYVTGRDGKPVSGLGKEDFTVEDDGSAQPVVAVDDIDLDRTSAEAGEDLASAARRRFLFLFDLSFASPRSILRARKAAIDFVAKGLLPEDLIAVATTSVEAGPRLLLTFTADRSQLVAALRSVGLPTLVDREKDPLAFAFVRPGDPLAPIPLGGSGDIKIGASDEFNTITQLYKAMAQKSSDQFLVNRVERNLGQMGSLAMAMDLVEGRKTVIFFSEGFDSSLLSGSNGATRQEADYNNEAMFHGMFWATDVDRRFGNSPLARNMDTTLSVFRHSDCVVYAVDIAGLRSEDGATPSNERNLGSDALYAIAGGTGGELIDNSNDLGRQLSRIDERTRRFYVLSFRPVRKRGEGVFHRLKVRVRRRGAHVSARAGYTETRGFGELSPLERALSSADIVMGGQTKGDFTVTTLGIPFRRGKETGVSLLVRLPPGAVESGSSGRARQIGIYVYATTPAGKLVDYVTRNVRIEGAAEERASTGGVLYSGALRLPAGDYRIRTLVRDEGSGRFGFGLGALRVPDFSDGAITLLPPLFLDPSGPGLKLRDGDDGQAISGLMTVGGEDFLPDPNPRIARDSHAQLCLLAYGVGTGDNVSPFRIEASVEAGDGAAPRPAVVSLVGRTRPDADGLVRLLIEFSAAGLPQGDYRLQVTVRDARDPARTNTSEASFHVL